MFAATTAWRTNPVLFDEKVDRYFSARLSSVRAGLLLLKKMAAEKTALAGLKKQFRAARLTYKKIAVLIEYFNPYQTKQLNGPAIPRIESEVADIIIPPQGFQAIEQLLFADWDIATGHKKLSELLDEMIRTLAVIEKEPDRRNKFKKELVFDALRATVVSITTTGITGFDSPIAGQSIPEAIASLEGVLNLVPFFSGETEKEKLQHLSHFSVRINKTVLYLKQQGSFNDLDRMRFITGYINPLYQQLVRTRINTGIGIPPGRNGINFQTESIFAPDALNIDFYSPPSEYWVTPDRVTLGKLLFSDPVLSGTKTRSCASCHKPELAFTDGLAKPYSIDNERELARNTPTVINSGLQTKQFWDSRADILENQLSEVVHNIEEMEGSMLQSAAELKKIPLYDSLFKKAYPAERNPVNPFTIANTISSYVRSLQSFNSRFDRYMRGDYKSLSAKEIKGFNLFAGKAKCATCHFIPLFNGLVPPAYADTESEVLGVPKTKNKQPANLDDDLGKFLFTKSIIHKFSFKTPTLRNVELTAPYMHNGVYSTLEEVIEFYNNGGGKGLNIAPEYQTLPFDKLNLSSNEIKDIIAFMKALTDTSFAK